MKTSRARYTHGFTLVEVIAVLIILGILLAVAVPKYFSLVEESKDRAAAGAVAEAKSLCSLAYSRLSLVTGSAPNTTAVLGDANTEAQAMEGDFDIEMAANGDVITITATGSAGTRVAGGSNTDTWTRPAD